jgi:hypothetical protein
VPPPSLSSPMRQISRAATDPIDVLLSPSSIPFRSFFWVLFNCFPPCFYFLLFLAPPL